MKTIDSADVTLPLTLGNDSCIFFVGIRKVSPDGKGLNDPEVLRRLTSSVSCALDEAAAALTRMRTDSSDAASRWVC